MSDVTWKDGPWRKIMSAVNDLDDSYVKVGVLAEKGDSEHGDDSITILELAAIHEFGLGGLEERSFIRSTFENSGDWLPKFQATLAKGVIQGKLTTERALEILGRKCADEVKNTITEKRVVPISKKVSEADARDDGRTPTTLVDTSQLVNSVSHEVVMGGGE